MDNKRGGNGDKTKSSSYWDNALRMSTAFRLKKIELLICRCWFPLISVCSKSNN